LERERDDALRVNLADGLREAVNGRTYVSGQDDDCPMIDPVAAAENSENVKRIDTVMPLVDRGVRSLPADCGCYALIDMDADMGAPITAANICL
jgi:predicted Ser/Thr protein kinase